MNYKDLACALLIDWNPAVLGDGRTLKRTADRPLTRG